MGAMRQSVYRPEGPNPIRKFRVEISLLQVLSFKSQKHYFDRRQLSFENVLFKIMSDRMMYDFPSA